jgi:tripartite-type tricarboxylate transporter receptor subunit TctC
MTTIAPDIPTMDESGVPGVDVTGWFGAAVQAAVPQPIKDKISSALLKMAQKPETKKWLTELGFERWLIGPAEARKRR